MLHYLMDPYKIHKQQFLLNAVPGFQGFSSVGRSIARGLFMIFPTGHIKVIRILTVVCQLYVRNKAK